jgi:hypothetical protein
VKRPRGNLRKPMVSSSLETEIPPMPLGGSEVEQASASAARTKWLIQREHLLYRDPVSGAPPHMPRHLSGCSPCAKWQLATARGLSVPEFLRRIMTATPPVLDHSGENDPRVES